MGAGEQVWPRPHPCTDLHSLALICSTQCLGRCLPFCYKILWLQKGCSHYAEAPTTANLEEKCSCLWGGEGAPSRAMVRSWESGGHLSYADISHSAA